MACFCACLGGGGAADTISSKVDGGVSGLPAHLWSHCSQLVVEERDALV